MDKLRKENWVKALRSGEYKQGKGRLELHNDDGSTSYCCLGVLNAIDESIYASDNFFLSLVILDINTQMRLAIMNDGGATFNEIAEYIEREL
jgi:hypothetical protein